jgi:eukaryotic-like serine/threonine-protein kinase
MDYGGQQFDQYQLIEKLGHGGMATVYKAFDTRLERDVAIKVVRKESIPPEHLDRILKRFEREAKALAKFIHPNIVPVHDYGEFDGAPYLVMAYLPGGTLKDRIGKAIPVQQALNWVIPIASALSYAHQRGVIHRDVKPSNILITDDGTLMLSDFGIAQVLEETTTQLTATGMGVGTPEYMAPEQWQGKADAASDQYALGVVLYELLTGQKPYTAETPMAVALKVMSEPLPRPSALVPEIPEGVEKVLYKALTRNPEDRYEDMAAFQDALEGLLIKAENQELEKHARPEPQSLTTPAKVEALVSEGETQDALDTTPAEGIQTAIRPAKPKKRIFPRWVLWSGAGIIGLVVIGLMIGVVGNLVNMGKGGDESLSMLVTETSTVTITPTFTQTESNTLTPTITLTPEPTLGIGSTLINEKDGAVMVYVPAGEFLMGSEDEDAFSDEAPEHTVYLDAYWIYQHEVTNEQYRRCIKDGVCSGSFSSYPENDFPAVYIDWDEANNYCEWAGGRLPTEAEWEKAARGTDGQTYPWGEESPTCNLVEFGDCSGAKVPVGSFPAGASPYGALDMAGNVWEWVADRYAAEYYENSPYENPLGPSSGIYHVIRGGCWGSVVRNVRASNRVGGYPVGTNFRGFRCLSSPDL